jgi:hypothetical protein
MAIRAEAAAAIGTPIATTKMSSTPSDGGVPLMVEKQADAGSR